MCDTDREKIRIFGIKETIDFQPTNIEKQGWINFTDQSGKWPEKIGNICPHISDTSFFLIWEKIWAQWIILGKETICFS